MKSDFKSVNAWRKICATTLNNYIHMEKRLSQSEKMSNFMLTYYSVFLIINSLNAAYFDFYNNQMCEYFGVILSVIMLAYSLINGNANYAQRIDRVTEAINELKSLRKKLSDEELDSFIDSYNSVVNNVEFRSDVDFFNTVKSMCREKNINCFQKPSTIESGGDEDIELIKGYLSEISPRLLQLKIFADLALNLLLLVFPVVVVIACITL